MKNHCLPAASTACAVLLAISLASGVRADDVPLQNATATFSQSGFGVSQTIDGIGGGINGWAITPNEAEAQTAVWQTVTDLGTAGGTLLTFTLQQNLPNGLHELGRFRISITTDDRVTFADGLESGGNVTANWVVLDPLTFTTLSGAILTKQLDLSLLASGDTPTTDTYTITAFTGLTGITGIRLEMIPDASLPSNGSGRNTSNGNFVLSEFSVDAPAVPEPSSLLLSGLGGIIFAGWFIRRRSARA